MSAGDETARLKQAAAERAVDFIESGMVVGLGTGSTAIHAVYRLGALLREGALTNIVAIATSRATDAAARGMGIPLMPDSLPRDVDITIDGGPTPGEVSTVVSLMHDDMVILREGLGADALL